MQYTLFLHYPEMSDAELDPAVLEQAQAAFGVYARALDEAGVLASAPDVLQPSSSSTTVTLRTGSPQVQDGPFADTKEQIGGTFVINVPDLDTAIEWAQKCPAAQWGTIEIRPSAITYRNGAWT
jgi:hypothetical protein